ncbi:hypothetical protein, partial [Nonomuraea angiospora]|uniref:hypothetical protein n=1 Tax=Nonomuraea angiospora TaxID=46172 RepID=UPI0029AB5EE7
APPRPPESSGRSRTRRQSALLAVGQHPLTLVLTRPLRLHAEAAPHEDRQAPGRRCGNCQFRQKSAWGYPKCTFGDGARASRGAGTDCRGWWPGCLDHEWKDLDG